MRSAGKGVVAVEASFPDGADDVVGWGAAFAATPTNGSTDSVSAGDAVEHRGARVESYVSDSPWIAADRPLIEAILPPPGFRPATTRRIFRCPGCSRAAATASSSTATPPSITLAVPDRPDA
jgi:hypothetical protein